MTVHRIAVVGLGAMGRLHAQNVSSVRGLELASVVDRDEGVARQAGTAFGAPHATSLDDALVRHDFEAAIVASPTFTHPAVIAQLAAAGRHIFSEKPIALDLNSTQRAVDAARAAGVIFHIGLHRRFDPDWQAVRRRALSGALGDIVLLRMSQRLMSGPVSASKLAEIGNIFVDTALHDFDAALWITASTVLDVSAFGGGATQSGARRFDHTDTAVVVLRLAGGALAVVDVSFVAGYAYDCAAELVATKGAVRIGADANADQLEWLVGDRSSRRRVGNNRAHHPAAYVAELEHFAAALRDEAPRESCVDDAVAAFQLAEVAAVSLREDRTVKPSERQPSLTLA